METQRGPGPVGDGEEFPEVELAEGDVTREHLLDDRVEEGDGLPDADDA